MAALVAFLISLDLLLSHFNLCFASTHWIVTEDGKIQSQMDSVFNMKRPYDLVAFLKQEERASMLEKLKKELLSRKDEIDKTDDGDSGLEEKFYKTDPDCLSAGKHLPDLDLYISTVLPLENKGIRPEDHLPDYIPGSFLMQPDCALYTDLPYSPYAFEHLEGMKDRLKLPGTPELGLKNAITYQDNEDEYGHRIYEAFQNNKTSWVLYNMAAFYWRIKGDPFNVIECVRRALHYSPRIHKDVALISLANVLHRARYSNEAAIVVHAALDISRELNVNHFTLGNIYAVLGEYNKSVICFENTLKIQPDFEAAAKRKHAVLCHAKLESALEAQHRSLQRTLNDLKDYQKKHDFWQQQNDKLMAEQVPVEVKLAQHVSYEETKIKELSTEIGEYCKMGDKDGKQVLMCSWGQKSDPALNLDLVSVTDKTAASSSQTILEIIDKAKNEIKTKDYSKPLRGQKFTYETVKVPRFHGSQIYLNDDWPSKEECDQHVQKVPDSGNLTSTYLSPENKGYEVKALLTEALGLKDGDEHPLPWYPPVCVTLLDIPEGNTKSHDDIGSISFEQRTKIPLKLYDRFQTEVPIQMMMMVMCYAAALCLDCDAVEVNGYFKVLLKHVNNGKVTIEEIGQRILTGLKQNVGPKWILFNLAGLYWRIIGNNYHGIECFRRSIYTAPDDVQDVPEVNLANILYRWGRYDDARELIRESMKLNKYEPATNFLFGNILWAQKNYTGAIWRYQLALEADPHDKDVLNTLRALKCFLKYHQAAQSAAPVEHEAKDGGEERCIIETRSRGKGDCGDSCSQTCSVPPSDGCPGNMGVNGPEGRKHDTCGHCLSCCSQCQQCVPSGPTNSCQQPKSHKEHLSGSRTEEIIFSNDFVGNLDEVTEHLERTGFCEGDECSKIRIQQNGRQPHIKLEKVNGLFRQKLIFSQSQNEVTVEPDECVIFNDGTKTAGCSRPEFKDYVTEFESINQNPDSLTILVNGHLAKILPIQVQDDEKKSEEEERGDINIVDKVPLFQAHVDYPTGEDLYSAQTRILQLPENKLPDTRKYVGTRMFISMPKQAECEKLKKINIQKFSSTWLSLSAKQVNILEHINFKTVLSKGQFEKPVCDYEIPGETVIDNLPGIEFRSSLQYKSENSLREVLQKIGGHVASVDAVGTRIAQALKKNDTSWILTNLAALYWRVQGDAARAIDCLRIALYFSPSKSKDIALLSTANILHRAGYVNDAIAATSYTMDVSKGLVVSHFNMANLYAAKGQWDKAAMFYESTLGLQSTFEPAKQRLQIIHCMKSLQKQEKKPA